MADLHYPVLVEVPPFTYTPQTIYDAIVASFPKVPGPVVGIAVPDLGIECKTTGIRRPLTDIKEAAIRMYNASTIQVWKPIWNLLSGLLKALGGIFDNFKIGILDLSITDLFSIKVFDKIIAYIKSIYYTAKDKLIAILGQCGIYGWPWFSETTDGETDIYLIAKAILMSFSDVVIRFVKKIIGLISLRADILELYYQAIKYGYGVGLMELIKEKIIGLFAGLVLGKFLTPPSFDDLVNTVKELAKKIYGNVTMTYQMLIDAILKYKLPVLGLPVDWKWPLDSVSIPNIDFISLLGDMKAFFNNIYASIVRKFLAAIDTVLKFFGLTISFFSIKFPIELCYEPQSTTTQTNAQPGAG